MGNIIDRYILLPILHGILLLYKYAPFPGYFTYKCMVTGLIKLVVHRAVLNKQNLYKAPKFDYTPPKGWKARKGRTDTGYMTDIDNPTTAMAGAPIGRNMPAIPEHLRDPHGTPDVQLVAQRLLAREQFQPAGDQLNILAASWIQAMVHDWIGHMDGNKTETLDKGAEHGCPFASFKFKNTKARKDGNFESERSNWWDASFVYGNDEEDVKRARTFKGGKMKTNEKGIPHILPEDKEGVYTTGDNKNSWVGVTVLQDIFIKEHNYVADQIAEENRKMTDDEIFDAARLVIAALVAKIHTIDWTVQLLDTDLLQVGMETNWYGIFQALLGKYISSWFYGNDLIPSTLSKVGKAKAENKGTPFCLTEEFAAVYRLHSLSPPGLVVGEKQDEFIPLLDLFGDKGREAFKQTPDRPTEIMKSVLSYPCGNLASSNYPGAYRDFAPTDDSGRDLPKSDHIDLAALDLFRDRERGIRKFNDFRRELGLKPYKSWLELTGGNSEDARKLELIYGPGIEGIERLDLLVGDMYEKKPCKGFALSETSFIIFLLMASRRLEADPFLHQNYTEEYYTKFGLKHIKETDQMFDLLERHYPELAMDFKDEKGKQKQSVFKPTLGPKDWQSAIDKNVVPKDIQYEWKKTADSNNAFFESLETKHEDYYKGNKSDGKPAVSSQSVYILLSVLLFVVPYFIHQNYADSLGHLGVRELWPVEMDVARELGYSNCRHVNLFLRIYHFITNPFIFISQVYLMDKSPSLIVEQFNMGFVYYVFLVVYGLLADVKKNLIVAVFLTLCYKFAVSGSYEDWLVRVVGENTKLRAAFCMYLFCQGSQIVVHCIFENYYDWNLFHLFIVQQHITLYNVLDIISGFIGSQFSKDVAYWVPIFEECMNGANHPITCGL